jgi:hypothetical protein
MKYLLILMLLLVIIGCKGQVKTPKQSCFKPEIARFGYFNTSNHYPIKIKGKWGYIDSLGNLLIPAIYDTAGRFRYNRALVCQNKKWEYILPNGNKLHDDYLGNKLFFAISEFENAFAVIQRNERITVIDTLGHALLDTIIKGNNEATHGGDCIIIDDDKEIFIPSIKPDLNHPKVVYSNEFSKAKIQTAYLSPKGDTIFKVKGHGTPFIQGQATILETPKRVINANTGSYDTIYTVCYNINSNGAIINKTYYESKYELYLNLYGIAYTSMIINNKEHQIVINCNGDTIIPPTIYKLDFDFHAGFIFVGSEKGYALYDLKTNQYLTNFEYDLIDYLHFDSDLLLVWKRGRRMYLNKRGIVIWKEQ